MAAVSLCDACTTAPGVTRRHRCCSKNLQLPHWSRKGRVDAAWRHRRSISRRIIQTTLIIRVKLEGCNSVPRFSFLLGFLSRTKHVPRNTCTATQNDCTFQFPCKSTPDIHRIPRSSSLGTCPPRWSRSWHDGRRHYSSSQAGRFLSSQSRMVLPSSHYLIWWKDNVSRQLSRLIDAITDPTCLFPRGYGVSCRPDKSGD